MRPIPILFLIHLLIFSCTQKTETKEATLDSGIDQSLQGKETTPPLTGGMIENGDSMLLPPFEIEVTLSDLAKEKLNADKETIIVNAYVSGEPKDSIDIQINEMGLLNLAANEIELDKPGVAKFDKITISRKAYEALANKDFEILINIYSGRRSSEYNLLNAEILQEPLSAVAGKRHVLNAKLIKE